MTHYMNLWDDSFQAIKEGWKTIEMRLNDEKRANISADDIIEFTNTSTEEKMECRVVKVHKYPDFTELYKRHSKESIGYKEDEEPNPEDMFKYYTKEQIEKYGVVGIEISVATPTYILASMYEGSFDERTVDMLSRVINKRERFAIIASYFESYELTDKFANIFYNKFVEAGLGFNQMSVVDGRMTHEEAQKTIREADMVWISGGDTPTEYRSICEYGLDKVLREHKGVLMGVSAGTLNLGKIVLCPKSNGYNHQQIYDGLGCVDITAFSHYDMGDIAEDKLELSYTYDFYYMTDDSYILCVGNKKEFYGNIYFVSKGKKKMICQDLERAYRGRS